MTLDPKDTDEKITSMNAPNVREGGSVDIDIDSGAEVSCLLSNIGAETYPLHETKFSMYGSHHADTGGGRVWASKGLRRGEGREGEGRKG